MSRKKFSFAITSPDELMLFCAVVFLCSGRMSAFVVLGAVSSVLAKRLAGKNVSEMTCFASSEM